MNNLYFSEREFGQKPRVENEIGPNIWGGIIVYVNGLINSGGFGSKFPFNCPDDDGVVGTDKESMSLAVLAEFPELSFPLDLNILPSTLMVLDFLEFCHEHVAKATKSQLHDYWKIWHLSFDREAGQAEFRRTINRIFARNGLAFEMQENGQIARIAPLVIDDYLRNALFQTGDVSLDSMLERARAKYLDPSFEVRLESLEKLWDAWERIKTLEFPDDKKKSVIMLLDKVSSEPKFRGYLGDEAAALTGIGNTFMIRHTEVGKTPITSSAHVDYLFHRMFAFIYLVLGDRIGIKSQNDTLKAIETLDEDIPF